MGVREEIIVEENEDAAEKEVVKKVPPDGGWGFVVILAYGLANAIVIPVLQTFGLIFNDKFKEMQLTATDSAMIVNVASAVGMGMGLFNGPLLRIYGYRKVSVASGVFFSIGLILTSWASTFTHFIITYSILTAIGFGMATSGFSLALNSYFVVRRNKAVGIAITITGLGPIFFPQFVTYLLGNYGVQGCVLIIGAFALHIVLAGLLLQPIKWHMVDAKPTTETLPKEIEMQPVSVMKADHFRIDSKRSSISSYHTVEPKTESLPRRTPEKKEEMWELSDDEEMYMEYPYRRISIDHNADIQSIYGFEVIHPMKLTLGSQSCSKTPELPNVRKCATIADLERVRNDMGSPPPSPGPLGAIPKKRWFETGSLDTVNLGSSMKIFDDPRRSHPGSRRGSRITEEVDEEEAKALTNGKTKCQNRAYNRTFSSESYYANLPIRKPLKKRFKRRMRSVAKFFDFDLLRDPIYVNMMLGMSIAVFAELNFSLFTPFILADMNFTTEEIASVMSLLAISDIIFRFLAPFIGDYFKQSSRRMYMYSLVLLIIARSCVPFATTHSIMLGVGVFLGIAKGIRSVYMSLVIPNYVSIDKLGSASGIQMVTNGILLLAIGPLMGVIRDLSGSYVWCIIFINIVTATTLIMWTVEMLYQRYKISHAEEHPEVNEKK
uniref:Putative monocarboxylate transporter n=1 Tax=Nyssomyia neivai TaxID=330878 RepID=A0A1L8DEV9_9DIPT